MLDKGKFRLGGLSGGVLLSLLAHGLIVAALLIDWPKPVMQAEPEEQVVAVTLVPPPEQEPEPEPEAETASEPASEPEEPEPASEQLAPPEPEPEAPLPDTQPEPVAPPSQAEAETDAGAAEEDSVPIQVLRPVFQFGEEDSGPELALDGAAPEPPLKEAPVEEPPLEEAPVEEPRVEELPAEQAEAPASESEPAAVTAEKAETQDPDEPPQPDDIPSLAMPAEITLPDADLSGDALSALSEAADQTVLTLLPEAVPADEPLPGTLPGEADEPDTASAAADTGSDAPPVPQEPELDEARELFSASASGSTAATTAMGQLPRNVRGSQLCTTELREQLRRAPSPYNPELLPSYGLPGGTVLAVPDAAFRAGGAWYDLSFRCTVDEDALKVTGFAFKVGDPIPRSTWKARGFPDF